MRVQARSQVPSGPEDEESDVGMEQGLESHENILIALKRSISAEGRT